MIIMDYNPSNKIGNHTSMLIYINEETEQLLWKRIFS